MLELFDCEDAEAAEDAEPDALDVLQSERTRADDWGPFDD
jgi:hypothetical protein